MRSLSLRGGRPFVLRRTTRISSEKRAQGEGNLGQDCSSAAQGKKVLLYLGGDHLLLLQRVPLISAVAGSSPVNGPALD